MICAVCGTDLGRIERVGRRDVCSHCGAELRTCRQCRFFEPAASDACREPQAERVADKGRANFCDYFGPGALVPSGATPAPVDAARAALDRLFTRR
jgi:hypothetical protein